MLSFIWTIIVGFIVGLLARALKPGNDAMGWLWTILLGIGGALLGGFIASALGLGMGGLVGLIMSVIGAVILLFIYEFARKKMA